MTQTTSIPIPGSDCQLHIERDADGRLLSISAAGREYVRVQDSMRIYDAGFVTMNEVEAPVGMLRHVRAGDESWAEAYLCDSTGLPERVDGVEIRRDEHGRIIACEGPDGAWRYQYEAEHLTEIISPYGRRRIARAPDGRPIVVEENGVYRVLDYSDDRRCDIEAGPSGWNRDEQGRLWTVTAPGGDIEAFYLWDGFHCLGRVDGAPGEPLAAVFSLDQTGTPVRIITRDGVTRVARDAFGESLLAHRDVPGLFGGAHHGEMFHYSARVLDPRLGSYNAPDPWHGREDDPRRADGYAGTLLVELPVAGPYAVCQYDPIGFVDPTGTIAWYYLLSTLTWAFPNNMLTWVGYELTTNFWTSLLTGQIDRFFSGEHLYSERFGIGAMQLDGAVASTGTPVETGPVYTTQHIIWAKKETFASKAWVSAFVPGGAILPRCYGTILRVVPDAGRVMLLRGSMPGTNNDTGYTPWARAGGEAIAVAPGILEPQFPSGGFHFGVQKDLYAPVDAAMTELEPSGTLGRGTLDNRLTLTILRTGLGIADGALVLIRGAAAVDIVEVLSVEERAGMTIIRLREQTLTAGTTDLDLRGLGTRQSSEVLARGAQDIHLNVTTANATYAPNDALRFIDGGNPVGAAILTGFEAQLAVDAQLGDTLRNPISVFALAPSGPPRGAELTAQASLLNFPTDPIPNVGDFLTVSNGTTTIAVAIVPGGTDRNRQVDRPIDALGGSGLAVSWQELARGSAHGARNADPEGASQITYQPITRGSAPASGFVGVEDVNGALAARTVTGVNYDVLVLGSTLPAGPAQFTVERYIPGGADVRGLNAVDQVTLALEEGLTLAGDALRLLQLTGADIPTSLADPGNPVVAGMSLNGAQASLPFQNPSDVLIRVADAVALNSSGNDIAVALQAIEMTIELDRDLTLAAEDLRIVLLGTTGPVYESERIDPLRVTVAPVVNGIAVQMPRFFEGEIVLVSGTDTQLVFRISNVAGTTLTLEGDIDIPTSAGDLLVQRMTVADPETGGAYLGIEGTPVHPSVDNSTRYVRARFWTNRSLVETPVVGIVSDERTLPARVTSIRYAATQSGTNPMQFDVDLNIGGDTSPNLLPVVNDIVFIEWTDSSDFRGEFVITAVSGATIDVAARGGGSAISPGATDVTVRPRPSSYNAVQPNPGSPQQLSVQATIAGATVAAPQFQVGDSVFIEWVTGTGTLNGEFDVTAVTGANIIDVVPRAGGTAISVAAPTISVRRLPVLDLTFSTPPAGAGATGDIFELGVGARHFTPGFQQESDTVVVINSDAAGLTSPSANLVLLIPFAATAVATGGHLSSGTVKAPDDPEHWEYDRQKAVAEHELRHTQQYNWFGPLWFCIFPMWILDTITASTTDMEKPAYSPFVPAKLRHDEFDEQRELEIPDMQSIPFATGDGIQIYHGNTSANVKLGAKDGNVFLIVGSLSMDNGDVFVRRQGEGWGVGYDVFMGIMRALTPGSVMNLLMTLTYGTVYQGIGRAIFLVMRLVDHGTLLPATVEQNGLVALLDDPSKLSLLRNEARVIVRVDDGKVIRTILDITGDGSLRLDVPLMVSNSRSVKVSQEGGNQQYDAEAQSSGGAVRMDKISEVINFSPGDRIEIILTCDTTVVKSVDSVADDGRITFRGALPVSAGKVNIAPYETHTPGTYQSWTSYYPATVNPEVRARVTLHPAGNDSLTLLPRDRVVVLFDGNSPFKHTTTVTAVNGDQVDLAEMIPTLPEMDQQELIVRLGKIGRDDPTGWLDQHLVDDLYDAGWVRWITDPFSQTFRTVQQHARGSFWDHFTRVASYLLGNNSWSLLPFGFYWWDALFLARARGKGYIAFIEQDASVHSGDLYTSIGRLRNDEGEMGDETEATMTVGDIALYWFWPGSRWVILPTGDNQDAPGVHLRERLCTMPLVTAETGGDAPNNGAGAAAVGDEPGHAIPDVFFRKNPDDPRDISNDDPRRFTVSTRGWVPMEPGIQRTQASYVAFTRPTTGDQRHRVTIDTTGSDDDQDRDAQDEGVQVIFYNVSVNDVTVMISGLNVANGDTVRLLQTQRAPVTATPTGQRRYRATVRRPADGPALRTTDEMVLQAGTGNTTDPEPVEISRFYHYDTAARQFDTGAIRGHGMHLPTDVDIPVRTFNVEVVDAPPVVASLPATVDFTIYGGTIPSLRPGGDVFVLVAASVMTFNDTIQYNAPAPAGTIDPVIPLTDATADASAALRTFLADGLGRPFRLALEEDDPPEEPASVNFEITVGEPGNQANLSVLIPIQGHFIASNSGGYQIPRGGTLVLDCAGIGGGGVTPLDTVQVTMTNGTPPPPAGGNAELSFSVAGSQLTISARADASTGVRRLLITDSADVTNRARRTVEIV